MGALILVRGVAFLAAALAYSSTSFADGSNAAIADGLFADAKRLLDAGDADHACPKFAESLRLAPTLGTRLNLARCYEIQGKLATAWGEYNELVRLGTQAGDTKRVQIAKDHIVALNPALPHVVLQGVVAAGAKLKLDDKELDAAVLGTPFAIDPGDHTIEVSLAGKTTRRASFHAEPARSTNVDVPQLVDAVTTDDHGPKEEAIVAKPAGDDSGKRIGGYVTIGFGVAAVAVGSVFGVMTLSLADQVRTLCRTGPGTGYVCPTQAAINDNSNAHTFALLSDVLVPVGVVAIGIGLYLALTASHKKTEAAFVVPLVLPGGTGVAAHWSF